MTTTPSILEIPLEGLRRLIGPVLEKELRVLSRRKRLYWLRSAYLLLMIMIVAGAWILVKLRGASASLGAARLAEMSRSVVFSVAWLQFIVCQILVVMLLSHAVNEEIRRKTFAALMTTPMRSVEIVLGKLLGQLLPIWMVLALSFPLLAIIRVWGGVPWDYVVSSFVVTLSTILCLAALCLFVSLWIERPHKVVLLLLSVMILGYFTGAMLTQFGWMSGKLFQLINPFSVLMSLSMEFSQAGVAANVEWQEHCLLMLGMATVFLLACVLCLRSRALAKPEKQAGLSSHLKLLKRLVYGNQGRSDKAIRSVNGVPLLWKELGSAPNVYLKRQIFWTVVLFGIILGCLILPEFGLSLPGGSPGFLFYRLAISAIGLLVMLRTATMAAWCVAQEKESRSWMILLSTPLPDIWILRHKALSVILKNAAGWIAVILGYMVYIFFLGSSNSSGMPKAAMMLNGISSLLGTVVSIYKVTGVGLYFSIRMRTVALAVTTTLGFLFAYNVVVGFFLSILSSLTMIFFARTGFPYMSMIVTGLLFPLIGVVVGAIMFKLAAKGLRKHIF